MADDLMKTMLSKMGLQLPQAGPAPTAEQSRLYEEMAQRNQGPAAKAISGIGDFMKGATVSDPMMPQNQLQGLPGMEKAGMLMGAAFIPPGLRRAQSLKVLEGVRTLPSFQGWKPEQVASLTHLQSQYPNVFAHVEEITPLQKGIQSIRGVFGKVGGLNSSTKKKGMSAIELNTNNPIDKFEHAAAHELGHAGQRIRDPRMGQRYEEAHKIFGYENNPYEKGANKSADNYVKRKEKKGK